VQENKEGSRRTRRDREGSRRTRRDREGSRRTRRDRESNTRILDLHTYIDKNNTNNNRNTM
jgi:hypothetical protein